MILCGVFLTILDKLLQIGATVSHPGSREKYSNSIIKDIFCFGFLSPWLVSRKCDCFSV